MKTTKLGLLLGLLVTTTFQAQAAADHSFDFIDNISAKIAMVNTRLELPSSYELITFQDPAQSIATLITGGIYLSIGSLLFTAYKNIITNLTGRDLKQHILYNQLGKKTGYIGGEVIKAFAPEYVHNSYAATFALSSLAGLYGYKILKNIEQTWTGEALPNYKLIIGFEIAAKLGNAFAPAGLTEPDQDFFLPLTLKNYNTLIFCVLWAFLDNYLKKQQTVLIKEEAPQAVRNLIAISNPETNEKNCYLCYGPLITDGEECIEVPVHEKCACVASKYLHRSCLLNKVEALRSSQELKCDFCEKPIVLYHSLKGRTTQALLALLS